MNLNCETLKFSKSDLKPEGLQFFEYLQKQNQNVLCSAASHFDYLNSMYYYQSDTKTYFKIETSDDNRLYIFADETSFLFTFTDSLMYYGHRTFDDVKNYIEQLYSKNYYMMHRNRI